MEPNPRNSINYRSTDRSAISAGPSPAGIATGRLGQPVHFWNLAFTDLWERFSFYSLQALLAYYLIRSFEDGGLGMSTAVMASVVGSYGAIAQIAQIGGAWLADRMVPPRTLVLYGGILIAMGHIMLAILPGFVGLFIGLGLVIFGTGALKSNLSRILGALYDADPRLEVRRDAGFTIYLAATNIGVIIGPLLAGMTQSTWGFHAGFATAAAGMLLGLAQYSLVYRRLPASAAVINRPISRADTIRVLLIFGLIVIAGIGLWFLGALTGERLSTTVGVAVLTIVIAYFTMMLRSKEVTPSEKTRLRAVIPLSIAGLFFLGLMFQIFTVIPVFITEHIDLQVGNWQMPELWFTSAISIGSVGASPLISALWVKMGNRQPGTMAKMAIAFAVVSVGFGALALTAAVASPLAPAVLCLVIVTLIGCAEPFLVPLMYVLGTKYMPQAFKNQGMGVMALCMGGGSVIAGLWGIVYAAMTPAAYFFLLTICSIVIAVMLLSFARRNQRALSSFS